MNFLLLLQSEAVAVSCAAHTGSVCVCVAHHEATGSCVLEVLLVSSHLEHALDRMIGPGSALAWIRGD